MVAGAKQKRTYLIPRTKTDDKTRARALTPTRVYPESHSLSLSFETGTTYLQKMPIFEASTMHINLTLLPYKRVPIYYTCNKT